MYKLNVIFITLTFTYIVKRHVFSVKMNMFIYYQQYRLSPIKHNIITLIKICLRQEKTQIES